MPVSPVVLAVLKEPATQASLRLTAEIAGITVPALAIFGILLGYVLGRGNGRWVSALDFLITLPLVFPPIATGFLLLLLLGRRSIIGSLLKEAFNIEVIFNFRGVVLAAFLAGLPLIVKQIQAAIRGETNRLIETASILGKSPTTTFFTIVLPSIRKSIVIGLSLAFARSLGEVGVTLMLGGNISGRTNTLSLEVYNAVFMGEYDRAFVLVGILAAVSLLVIFLTRRMARES